MGLVGLPLLYPRHRADVPVGIVVNHRLPFQGVLGLPVVGSFVDRRHHLVVVHVAGHRNNHVGRIVLPEHILPHVIHGDVVDRLRGAAHVPAHGLLRPQDFVNEQVHPVGWVVVGHPQLFLDNLPLLLHFLRVQQRVQHQVQEHRKGLREVEPGHLAPEDGNLPVGAGVHHAAHALNGLADLAGRGPVLCPLEGQMLQEVGQAGQFVGFVAGTGSHADGNGNRRGMGHSRGEDAQLVIQYGTLVHSYL